MIRYAREFTALVSATSKPRIGVFGGNRRASRDAPARSTPPDDAPPVKRAGGSTS